MPEARRADRRAASADQAACIIITIIISLSTKNNTFCVFPLHVYCIHLARGMMRMRIPSIICYCMPVQKLSNRNNYIICYCMPVQKLSNRNNYIICYCIPVQNC